MFITYITFLFITNNLFPEEHGDSEGPCFLCFILSYSHAFSSDKPDLG